MIRHCGICHRDRFIPDRMGACPTCLDSALTEAFRTTTERRLGYPLPTRLSAVARASRDESALRPAGNLVRATGS